ncbi:site-specific integrase [Clostridium sp. C2-6-12]|uniref:tyrosine-type recombinase/integrase n=1 Tax=Clostridium sp. C2-6-12 TaxID=2698832 RepID=UPI00136D786B|nr:site-specific integrase [Clostridium sp. C2-6-12]
MEYNVTYRDKDSGIQVIISYKDELGRWKQKSKQGFPNTRECKKSAKIAADKMLQELKAKINLNSDSEYQNLIFKNFITIHKEHMKLNLETNTLVGYETALKHFKDIEDMDITTIKSIHIQKCVDLMVSKGLKSITIKTYLQKLSAFFKAAIYQYNLILINPVNYNNIKFKTDKNVTTKRVLNSQEEEELLSKIKNKKYHLISIIAAKCGLRLGEILALTWTDIDFDNRKISINKQWKQIDKKIFDFGSVKSKNSNRIVPIPKSVLENLKIYKKNSILRIDGRIFTYKNTISTGSNLHREYVKLGFDISIHELRHTYATNLIANGVDFKTAAKFLGHDVEMTMSIYSHVNDEMLKRATDIIDKYL